MVPLLLLDPNAVYDKFAVCLALDIPQATIDRARREGHLRFTRKGRRVFFLGRWLIDWFESDGAARQGKEAAHA